MASCRISMNPCSLAAQTPSRSSALARAAGGRQSGVAVPNEDRFAAVLVVLMLAALVASTWSAHIIHHH
jgi:hypothetical protein